jgi:outer membrane lipoprotein SlyB
MSEANVKMNPLIATAAVAVIIFSAVGVGVMTGVIPSSKSSTDALTPAEIRTAPASEVKSASAPDAIPANVPVRKPSAETAQKRTPGVQPHQPPQQVAMSEPAPAAVPLSPPPAPEPIPAAAPVPPPTAAALVCAECGVIDRINVVEKKGSGGAVGVAGGAVVGGLLGHQVGSGRGNTAATVLGAVGGALAGNEVEKRVNTTKEYHVIVRMEDGNTRYFTYQSAPPYAVGERVKVINGKLSRGRSIGLTRLESLTLQLGRIMTRSIRLSVQIQI